MALPTGHSLLAAPLLGWGLLLSSACAQAPVARPQAEGAGLPSRLDCLVFASLADSPNLLAVSSLSNPPDAAAKLAAKR